MKENFEIKVETYHIADRGQSENVHQLPPEKLKLREVVHIDIAKVSNLILLTVLASNSCCFNSKINIGSLILPHTVPCKKTRFFLPLYEVK